MVGQEWRGALRASAHRSGRDNDPGGLGDMPDSQGPNMAEKHIGTGVSDPHSSQASLPSGTNIREGNVQWMYISDMFIGHFPSSSYSPHICGLVVI